MDSDLNLSTLFARTAVCEPYFAFSRVWSTDVGVAAIFLPEHPMEQEVGPIAAAEAGRHLAILGSCAAAVAADDRKRYYLATRACLRRTEYWPGESTQLVATAAVTSMTRREVTAVAQLSAGKPIFTLDCSYQILEDRLFERLYHSYRTQPNLVSAASPYRENISFGDISLVEAGLVTTCGPLNSAACAGHFPLFPAWPIAVIMHSLSRLAGNMLHRIVGSECRYSVFSAAVSADQLAFAVEPLLFRVVHDAAKSRAHWHHFHCSALLHEKTVGAMHLVLESFE